MQRGKARNKWLAGGAALLAGISFASIPAVSANATGYSYGYATCSSPNHPTTMSYSSGYTFHQIDDGVGAPYHADGGTGAIKFHTMGLANTTAISAFMDLTNWTSKFWGCASSYYYSIGW